MNEFDKMPAKLSTAKQALYALEIMQSKLDVVEQAKKEPIAIIGMGCRFPGGASDPQSFWKNLHDEVNVITEIPQTRWDIDRYYDPDPDRAGKMYTRHGGYLDAVEEFDADFFGISPREATDMDPQQRLMLEVAWEALENAGQAPDKLIETDTGVFVGIMTGDYSKRITHYPESAEINAYYTSGNEFSFTAGRISHILGLHGPSMAVDTACSSSTVAIHLACQSLRLRECDLAIAGGVNLILSPELTIALCRFNVLSADGRCKTFDEAADGFGRGEGCGAFILKRLSDAIRDRDNILALIRGSTVNHDGPSGGLTVPNGIAQQSMIRKALVNAGVAPAEISYVEAHGTGTALGDPIEVQALTAVLGEGRPADKPLVIGSVKTNINHLDSAAGVAGLIKVVLSLQHGEIPAHLHFKKLNPAISFNNIDVKIPTQRMPWLSGKDKRLAGVSSFGFSGTNAHVVVEEAPEPGVEVPEIERPLHLLSLSSRNEQALKDLAERYVSYLSTGASVSPGDVCYTANTGRAHFGHRLWLMGDSVEQVRERLTGYTTGAAAVGVKVSQLRGTDEPKVAFVFTGQGSQYAGMGRQLYETQPTFRKMLNRCDELLRPHLEQPLLSVIYPESGSSPLLSEAAYVQPALFALEYSLAQLWRSWGIEPEVVAGHSVGEYVAACVAGVFSLEDGLKLITERGRLMQSLPHNGAMAAVFAGEARLIKAIKVYADTVSLAGINAPTETVISGVRADVDAVVKALGSEGIESRMLKVSHAFHSPLMEPILDAFERKASEVRYGLPQIGLISNVSGQLVTEAEVCKAGYWRHHIRQPVRFLASLETLHKLGYELFVEIGPQPILSGLGMQCLPDKGVWLPSLREGRDDWQQILESLGMLYGQGVSVDWSGFDRDYPRRKVALPTYPFQRKRYWIKRDEADVRSKILLAEENAQGTMVHPLLGRRLSSPLKEFQFESRLRSDRPSFLADHKVYGAVVMPGTAYVEMAMAAARAAFEQDGYQLENVSILEALILPDDTSAERTVQLTLSSDTEAMASFQIVSLKEDGNWVRHANGDIRLAALERDFSKDDDSLSGARQRCQEEVEGAAFYGRLHEAGLEYGPVFQGIKRLWRCDQEALGFVQLPDTLAEDAGDFQVHPALLDACFQVSMATLPEFTASATEAATYVPVGFERFCVYSPLPSRMWVDAVVRATDRDDKKGLKVDLRLFNESGHMVAEVGGLYLRRVSRETLQKAMQADFNNWLYEVSWELRELENEAEAGESKPGIRDWLIFTDHGGIGTALASRFRARGEHCVLVAPGEGFAVTDTESGQLNPANPSDFQQLLQETAKAERPLRGVVYLWGLDSHTVAETEQSLVCGGLLHLVQALAATSDVGTPKMWVITRGVQPAGTDSTPLSVGQAPLWGLGGTIATEHPEFGCVRIDLDPLPETDESEALLREIWSGGGEAQVALRSNNRYVARLVPSRFTGDAAASRLELPEDRLFQLDIKKRGLLENLEFRTVTRNQPGPDEVEIRVRATGLNFKDILKALGQYTGPDILLGDECTGEITTMGEGVVGLQVGDKVVAVAQGSFGSYAISRAELVARKPGNLSFTEAATIPIAFLTAYYTLHNLARISVEKRVLIHVAAGGVGQAAVQLAQQVGAEIIATAGSPRKRAFLRSMGIKYVMDSRTLDFADKVMDITAGHGVDVVLNSLAGDFIPKSLSVVAPGGCFLEIGRTGIWEEDEVYRLRPDIDYFAVFLVDLVERQPSLIGELLQKLVAGFQAGDLKALPYRDFAINEAIDAFRYMAQAKQIGKIVLSQEDEAHRMHAGSVKDNATYLITGGSGGLGLKTAEWLVEQGAKHLVLVGRSGANDAALTTVGNLEKLGAQVLVAKADISEETQVGSLLSQIADTMPPLKGIIHSAGVLDDGFLIQQNWQSFDRVMAPKVNGAWNLHLLTQDKELDFFILFSSTASLLSAPGQGNYAAANAFLDALAHYRRARQLPALSINWGPWEEVGMVAAADKRNQRRLMEQGMHFIPPATGMHILSQLLQKEVTQAGVIPIDWEKYCRYHQAAHILPFLDHLLQKTKTKNYDEKPYFLNKKEIGAVESTLDQASIEDSLCEQVSRILRLPLSSISITQPLKELGIDSLMAHELFNRVESSFGRRLPLAVLIKAPTIEQLARTICDYSYEASWSPLVEVQTRGSNPPFYCVHGHRGNILGFRELSDLIGPDTPFYALQAQGMGERSFEIGTFEQIAEVYLREIQAVQPKGPYYLGGFCMGGAIAYHIAQLLQKQNEEVALLALIESAHPHFAKLRLTSGRLSRIVWSIYERADYELGNLRLLNAKEKILYIERKIRAFKNLLQVFAERIAEMLAAPLHFNIPHSRGFEQDVLYDTYLRAYLNYMPGPYQGRTIVFSAEKQVHGIIEDATLGWCDLIRGEMKVIKTPGHYLNVLAEPGIQTIAKCLKEFIDKEH